MERTDWMIELDSNTKFPLPVLHDSKRNVSEYNELDWVMRIREELDEALAAPTQLAKAQEIVDAITVGVSWLNQLGFDEASRTELYELSNGKNIKRGYMRAWGGEGHETQKNHPSTPANPAHH